MSGRGGVGGWGGIFFFGVEPVASALRPRSFLSVLYLLKGYIDFNQTCTDTALGGENMIFSDLELIFKATERPKG